MHQALKIDEVTRLICGFIRFHDGYPSPRHSPRTDLLHLALTCKSLKDAALDTLWGTSTSISHIFYPFIAWGALLVDLECDELALVRQVTHHDWTLYAPYAARIVAVNWHFMFRISEEACMSLLASCPKTTVFPRIRRLIVRGIMGTEFLASSLFRSPSLLSLEIQADSYSVMPSLLSNMGFGSENIKQLGLTLPIGEDTTAGIAQQVTSALESVAKIQVFNFEAPSSLLRPIFNSFPQLQRLQKLRISSNSHGDMIQTQIQHVELPKLTDLSLISRHTELDLSAFSQLTKLCPLKTLYLRFKGRLGPDDVSSALKSIQQCVWNSVETVVIEANGPFVPEGSLALEHLRALSGTSFASLRSLDIGGFFAVGISDPQLELLGQWCPVIESLHLRSSISASLHPAPTATLKGLIALGRALKNLVELTLPVKVDPIGIVREPRVQTSMLVRWNPSYSTIVNPFLAATTLLYYFPYLESVEPSGFTPRPLDLVADDDSDWAANEDGPNWPIGVADDDGDDDGDDNGGFDWVADEEREQERTRAVRGFNEVHDFIDAAAKSRKPGQSTRDAAKELFG